MSSFFQQRHFSVFAVNFPSSEALMSIFGQILSCHLTQHDFSLPVQKSIAAVVQAAVALHHKMDLSFLPTAVKFHYTFNMRDMSNIFQVMPIAILYWNFLQEGLWMKQNIHLDACGSGYPLRWTWECGKQRWSCSALAPWVLQSLLWQAIKCQRRTALPEAPDGHCAWVLWGAIQIQIPK